MSAEVQALYAKAKEELLALKGVVVVTCKTLEEGCSLETAYEIVDRCWLPTEANRIKIQLSAEFPARNGRIILDSPLSGEVSMVMAVPGTAEFLSKVFPEVIAGVEQLFEKINDLGTSNPEAIEQFTLFRKEPARFVDYVKDLWYPNQGKLVAQEYSSWESFSHDTRSIDNGEYMLLTDYRTAIRDAQARLDERLVNSLQTNTLRFNEIGYRADDLIGLIELIMLFAQYIDRKLAE